MDVAQRGGHDVSSHKAGMGLTWPFVGMQKMIWSGSFTARSNENELVVDYECLGATQITMPCLKTAYFSPILLPKKVPSHATGKTGFAPMKVVKVVGGFKPVSFPFCFKLSA